MKAKLLTLFLIALTFPHLLFSKVNWSSELVLDKRFLISKDDVPVFPMFNSFKLKAKATETDHFGAYSSIDFRFYDFPTTKFLEDMNDPSKQNPYDLLFWEGYVDVYDMFIEGLDMRIGKQRISWGKADKLNPTDNLNPEDFSDITNFGEKVPTFAVNLNYTFYLGDSEFKLQYVYLPAPRNIIMPRYVELPMENSMMDEKKIKDEMTKNLKDEQKKVMSDLEMENPEQVEYENPAYNLKNSMHAVKLSGTVGIFDFSLSYFNGYDDIPVPVEVDITNFDIANKTVSSVVKTSLNRFQVVGFDTAFELFEIGFWGEVGFFFPDKAQMSITSTDQGIKNLMDTMLGKDIKVDVLSDDMYVKYTVGFDYTFKWGTYINFQYAHGFFTERGDNLNDYFMARIEHKLFNDQLKVALGGGFVTHGFEDVENNYAYMVFPEITSNFYDNVEISIGGFIVDGKGDNFITLMNDFDQVYLRVKGTF